MIACVVSYMLLYWGGVVVFAGLVSLTSSSYSSQILVLCGGWSASSEVSSKILLQYFRISEGHNCTKGLPKYNYVGAEKFFVITYSYIFSIFCEKRAAIPSRYYSYQVKR